MGKCSGNSANSSRSNIERILVNSVVEVTNKNIKRILVKMIDASKDWHELFPFALCTYHTFVCTSMDFTLYSLVYGMEAILPIKVEIPSLKILS